MAHHRVGLTRLLRRAPDPAERGETQAFIGQLLRDWRQARLGDRERALLEYADKLTRRPGAMVEADLAPLRAVGMSDRAILEANLVVAYFAYANRIADGLGVVLEEGRGD